MTYVAGMTDRYAFDMAVRHLDWPAERLPRGIDRDSLDFWLPARRSQAQPNRRTSGPDCVVIARWGARTRHEPGIVRVANRRKSARHRVAAQRFARG